MPVLLVSLGTSWAVVPEAFHALSSDGDGFSEVHVLTTASPKIDEGIAELRAWFATRQPAVALTITRVEGFTELRSDEDHFVFEEVMYRWMLETAPAATERHVCLAGGFKTMSAAMQKAAAVLGAAAVFHVLAHPAIATADLVDQAIAGREVNYIHLGAESGWPQLRTARASAFPLTTVASDGLVRTVRSANANFRARLHSLVERSHRIAENWSTLADLPFSELATWAAEDLRWLHEPLDPEAAGDHAWLAALPKFELHCHLGGFATHGDELTAVRAAAEDPAALPSLCDCTPPADWPLPSASYGLEPYRHLGDNTGSSLLRDPGCLRAQCEQLYAHFLAQRIAYAEVRCSPANYADPSRGRSPLHVLTEIKTAFDALMSAAAVLPAADRAAPIPCHLNLIIIATRQDRGDFRTAIGRHLTLAVTAAEHWTDPSRCRVVGVDLAGYEAASTRAHHFRDDFKAAHRCGLALTVHAGENDDAEGIWSAVLDLNARRLGHALALQESPDLLRTVADRGIAVEMCPYANLQIKGYPLDDAAAATAKARYPLLDYLGAGVRVTVNTDNIGISAASLTDNLLLAARLCPGLTRLDVLRLQRHALDAAFISPSMRTRLLAAIGAALPRP